MFFLRIYFEELFIDSQKAHLGMDQPSSISSLIHWIIYKFIVSSHTYTYSLFYVEARYSNWGIQSSDR